MTYRDEVLADNPSVYLTFEGDSLTTNLGPRDVTLVSSSVQWTDGRYDRAPLFRGVSYPDHVHYRLNPHDLFNGSEWTIEAWFRYDPTATDHAEVYNSEGSDNQIVLFVLKPFDGQNLVFPAKLRILWL